MTDVDELIDGVTSGRLDRVKELLEAGGNVDSRQGSKGETLLMLAIRAGNIEMVQLLIAHSADVNAQTWDSQYFALQYASNKPAIARLLIDSGAEARMVDAFRQSALMWAAQSDCGEVVAMLLEKGANPTSTDIFHESPLHYSEINKKNNVLPLLRAAAALAANASEPPLP